jgi:type IV pilus assembly protein PilY1
VFVTVEPSTNPCEAGGNSWIMQVNAMNGARSPYSTFDINNDNKFDSDDYVTMADGTDIPASGVGVDGVVPGITLLSGGASSDNPPNQIIEGIVGSSNGGDLTNVGILGEKIPRASWRELQ